MGYDRSNERSRIARLGGLAIHPDFRGRHVADEAARLLQRHLLLDLGYHRLELEIYAFNERAIRHAERAGFVREGTRRKAYWRHGDWVDGVLFGLVREDLDEPMTGLELLHDHVARFNEGVRTGDYGPMLERFSDGAELAFEGVPVGPFRGREQIAAAYRDQPPDDEVRVLDAQERADGVVVARYGWANEPGVAAGEMRVTREGDRIVRLEVTFG
jgi:steroid Delta-isomerase